MTEARLAKLLPYLCVAFFIAMFSFAFLGVIFWNERFTMATVISLFGFILTGIGWAAHDDFQHDQQKNTKQQHVTYANPQNYQNYPVPYRACTCKACLAHLSASNGYCGCTQCTTHLYTAQQGRNRP